MNLDFETLHREFLTGCNGPNGWCFTPANRAKPGSDFYAASHQIFSNNALSVSLLIRNTLDPAGVAISAVPLLSLAFSRKVNGSYLLASDAKKLVIPLTLAEAMPFYTFLHGGTDSVLVEVVRPGVSPKYLKGYVASNGAFRFNLKAYTSERDGDLNQVEIAIGPEHVFHLQAFMLALGRIIHPWLDTRMVSDLYLSSCRSLGNQEAHAGAHKSPEAQPVDAERASKAVFAVGVNKWPAKRRDVIRHIQDTATPEQMSRLVQEGNSGNFTEWDKIASLMD